MNEQQISIPDALKILINAIKASKWPNGYVGHNKTHGEHFVFLHKHNKDEPMIAYNIDFTKIHMPHCPLIQNKKQKKRK